jgi:hypothetical protein
VATAPATLRRLEPLHVALAAVWGGGFTFAAFARHAEGLGVVLALLTWAADGLTLLYLLTLAATVRVTPTHVLVNNPYVRYVIPRRLVQGIGATGYWIPHLLVDGARPIRLAVLERNLPQPGYGFRPSHRQGRLIMRMIAEVPALDSSDELRRRLRLGHLALAVAMPASWAMASVYLLSQQ